MQKLNDRDLGTMYFDDSDYHKVWTLERRINFNGHSIPVEIEPEDFETLAISQVQRQAVQIALNLPSDTFLLSAPVVIQNYKCDEENLDETELLELTDPIDIWNSVEPSYILVPAHEDVIIPTFILYAECIWDEEHGLEVRFRNGYADESDQQGHLEV